MPALANNLEVEVRAFASLYRAQFTFVWNNLHRLGVIEALLEDATHDVFVAVYQQRGSLSPGISERTWLIERCRPVAAKYRRIQIRQLRHASIPLSEAQPTEPDLLTAQTDGRTDLVQRFLGSLNETQRKVFELGELEQRSVLEIAQIMGMSPNCAAVRLGSARDAFSSFAESLEMEPRADVLAGNTVQRVWAHLRKTLGTDVEPMLMWFGSARWFKKAAVGAALVVSAVCGGVLSARSSVLHTAPLAAATTAGVLPSVRLGQATGHDRTTTDHAPVKGPDDPDKPIVHEAGSVERPPLIWVPAHEQRESSSRPKNGPTSETLNGTSGHGRTRRPTPVQGPNTAGT